MAPVTEMAQLPLKAGSTIMDANTPEGKILQDALTTLTGQDGCQKVYFGTEVENPTNLRLFIDWDSRDHHGAFEKSRDYGPFLKNLGSVMDGSPQLFHVPFNPFPPTTALSDTSAPATEVVTMYFPKDISRQDQESHTNNIAKLGEAFTAIEGFKGASMGWALEELDYEKADGKAKVFTIVVGWQSVDAHLKGTETQVFKDNVHYLMDVPSLGHAVFHVNARQVDGGQFGGIGAEERGALGGGSANAQEEVLNPQGGGIPKPKSRSDGTTTKNQD